MRYLPRGLVLDAFFGRLQAIDAAVIRSKVRELEASQSRAALPALVLVDGGEEVVETAEGCFVDTAVDVLLMAPLRVPAEASGQLDAMHEAVMRAVTAGGEPSGPVPSSAGDEYLIRYLGTEAPEADRRGSSPAVTMLVKFMLRRGGSDGLQQFRPEPHRVERSRLN